MHHPVTGRRIDDSIFPNGFLAAAGLTAACSSSEGRRYNINTSIIVAFELWQADRQYTTTNLTRSLLNQETRHALLALSIRQELW